MTGLELSQKYYEAFGEQMLQQFPQIVPYIAVGLIGSGSECLGYDDLLSQDHDFEPGFCMFLPGEELVSSRDAFQLERAYAKLPREFMGYTRPVYKPTDTRHGVIRIHDFLQQKIGSSSVFLSPQEWFSIEEQYFLEVTNGKLFYDGPELMTQIRKSLEYLPEDIRLKKLTGNLLVMAQAGQYNYERCAVREDSGAAQLAMFEFVKATLRVVFLLNRQYIPYYKWVFRALRELPDLSNLHDDLIYLISSNNNDALYKLSIVRNIIDAISQEIQRQGLAGGGGLEQQAYAINEKIRDISIRNMHLMCAV